jgi:mRNA-degrading endonuclease toxin of MazEF toxin-antitoxin module
VIFERWDVVTVEFPFVEGVGSKRRPALIVSTDRLRQEHDVYWIMMITTAKAGQRQGDIAVSDRDRAGLPEECVIRASRLMTVGDTQIGRKLGNITPKDRNAVSAFLRRYAP